MNGKQLRNSILQWAISGRLVPQDPADEPASNLLARIKALQPPKGGTKKSKPLPPIPDDEKPFEIPDTWEWVRLQSVCELIEDCPHSTAKDEGEGYPLIRTPNVGWGRLNLTGVHRVSKDVYNQRNLRAVPQANDLIFAREAPAGNIAVIQAGQQVCLGQRTVLVRPISKVLDSDYLAYYILSPVSQEALVGKSTGTTVAHVNLSDFRPYVIALPPLAEQRRIVEKIEELMPLVERYDKAQRELDRLNSQLKDKLKKSILQEAIQGRLVPHSPTDEPASKLLARAPRPPKGGTKKSKPLPPIPDEEKPFDIPDTWEWVRLGEICDYIHRGKSPKYGLTKTLPIIAQKCNQWDKLYIDKCLFADEASIASYKEEQFVRIGDVLVNSTGGGTVGRTGIVSDEIFDLYPNYVVDSHVTVVRPNDNFEKKYVYYYLLSPYIQTGLEDRCSGSTNQIELATSTIQNYLVPLPPLAEQHRIVEKIEQLFSDLENL